jgi:hypothetical protein
MVIITARCLLRRLPLFALLAGAACAQQPVGSVGLQDATVAGALEVSNGQAVLVGSTTVTAKDHTAEVTLSRGGVVRVCSTSGLHLTSGKSSSGSPPLMLALDRGAVEVKMSASTADVVMTPDLRFVPHGDGPLDLHLRVTRNGDTCVENRGAGAPTLTVTDQFGDATYELRRGQHVLFEHGSLREVVDSESSPCGCPVEPVVSVADAGVTSSAAATPGSVVAIAAAAAAEQHPFPAAVSQGLSPDPAVPAAPAGVVHAQVDTTLSYAGTSAPTTSDGSAAAGGGAIPNATPSAAGSGTGTVAPPGAGAPAASSRASAESPTTVVAQAPPPPAPPSSPGFGHRIGHFFKRLFGRG